MEQRTLRGPIGIVDRYPEEAPAEQAGKSRLRQFFSGEDDRRCSFSPKMANVRLAATRRTIHHERRARPNGPPIYPVDHRGIAVGDEEIRPVERPAAGQIQGELGHRTWPGRAIMRAHRTR